MQSTGQLLTDNRYQNNYKTTDKQLTVTYKEAEQVLNTLPFAITDTFRNAVIGHIQHFGAKKVTDWANMAASKNAPERYFMVILSRQRYGSN